MDIRKIEHILLVSFCTLIVLPLLYIYRFIDNNTFTSWQWVFSQTGILQVFFFLIPALLCAYVISRIQFSGRPACVFLFLLSFASVIPLWQQPESIIDASRYFVQAKSLQIHGARYFLDQWGSSIHAWTDMPLVPFLYGLIFAWLGEARLFIQLFNTTLFALTTVLTFLIGQKLWDEETGLHAGLLLLGIPYLLTQVPLMLVDVPTMFFLTLSIYAFLQALEKGGLPWTAFASLALCMAVFSKYSTWLMLSVIPIISVIAGTKDLKKAFGRTCSVLLITGLLAGAVIFVRYDFFMDQIMILRTYQWSGLSRWQEGFLSTFLFQTHPFVTILAICGIYRAVRKKDLRFLIAAWFVVLVLILQIKRIRYIIPLFPLFALMAAYGLQLIRDKGVKQYISLCIVASSLVLTFGAYMPYLNTAGMANLQHAGQYLNTMDCGPVEVYALPQESSSGSTFAVIPILDYYTDAKLVSPQEWPGHLQDSESQKSSLRFTWETRKPDLYEPGLAEKGCAVVIISSGALGPAAGSFIGRDLDSLKVMKEFGLISAVFKYQTVVTILRQE
ncbi:MAG: glycosyltransferase family 39 protein [Nitrospirota bacterium]|nr:glycosyltransferase family 39 protein [Nitrospirota bacterium]